MAGGRVAALAAALSTIGIVAGAASAAGSPHRLPPAPRSVDGHRVQQVAAGLKTPTSFAFGDGVVFEGDGGTTGTSLSGPTNGGVYVLKAGYATPVHDAPGFVGGMAWHAGTLYLSGGTMTSQGPIWQLLAWSGWNGTTFTRRRVVYTASTRVNGFNGIAFGPDGRLYLGVDVGLTDGNDHGPPATPYVYDILSIAPSGRGLKVFATGIRQPWQFAFTPGSRWPLVSDLGQDSGAKNPPDLVLRVHQGDNYGFPKCNWTSAERCRGYTKPFMRFAPHADIMGLAVIGRTLYMSSFGVAKGGSVLSMPIRGGRVKPVLTGFAGPVVGLGQHAGWLYVGELNGQVFRARP